MKTERLDHICKRSRYYSMWKRDFIDMCEGDIAGAIAYAHERGCYVIDVDYNDLRCLVCIVPAIQLVDFYLEFYINRPNMLSPTHCNIRSDTNAARGLSLMRGPYHDCLVSCGHRSWKHDLYQEDADHDLCLTPKPIHWSTLNAQINSEFISLVIAKKWEGDGKYAEIMKLVNLRLSCRRHIESCIQKASEGQKFRLGPEKPAGALEPQKKTVTLPLPSSKEQVNEQLDAELRYFYRPLAEAAFRLTPAQVDLAYNAIATTQTTQERVGDHLVWVNRAPQLANRPDDHPIDALRLGDAMATARGTFNISAQAARLREIGEEIRAEFVDAEPQGDTIAE